MKQSAQLHIGVKLINAIPMNRFDYNKLRGWEMPSNENGEDEGFLVEYLDGGKANTPQFEGYVSWSPKEVFENAYRPVSGMNFGLAIEALKLGKKVARKGWNGKRMWLGYVSSDDWSLIDGDLHRSANFSEYAPWIGMKTADNKFVPWLASQTDMLGEDWEIVK